MTFCIYISIPWIRRRWVWERNTRRESWFTSLMTCSWSPTCAKRSADVTNSIRIGWHLSCTTSQWTPSWESHVFALSIVTKLIPTSATSSSSSSSSSRRSCTSSTISWLWSCASIVCSTCCIYETLTTTHTNTSASSITSSTCTTCPPWRITSSIAIWSPSSILSCSPVVTNPYRHIIISQSITTYLIGFIIAIFSSSWIITSCSRSSLPCRFYTRSTSWMVSGVTLPVTLLGREWSSCIMWVYWLWITWFTFGRLPSWRSSSCSLIKITCCTRSICSTIILVCIASLTVKVTIKTCCSYMCPVFWTIRYKL